MLVKHKTWNILHGCTSILLLGMSYPSKEHDIFMTAPEKVGSCRTIASICLSVCAGLYVPLYFCMSLIFLDHGSRNTVALKSELDLGNQDKRVCISNEKAFMQFLGETGITNMVT